MNSRKLVSSLGLLLSLILPVSAQKPLVGSWFANDVKSWSPEKDASARFNRSSIQLQSRFEDKSLLANTYQQYDGKICDATIMWNKCSAQPSQGAFDFSSYTFTHWQYVDMMIYWAGAASEGLICPPSAPWIDAAHANGVIMLGQIFLNGSWGCGPASQDICTEMFKRDNADGRSEFAKQLYAIANYFGFDGWFINEEYGGGSNEQYKQFFADYYYYAEKDGNKQYMQWYNANFAPTSTIVDAHPNTSQFLEYNSQYECTTPEDFSKYFSGLEVVKNGLDGGASLYKNLFNKDKHKGSIDLFCPEEHIWKDVLKSYYIDTENYDSESRSGTYAYQAQSKIFDNESRYFVNASHDPSNTSGWDDGYWPGFATTCAERSIITKKPFFTAFGNGLGKHRFVNGGKKGTQDWSHMGMQDIMPTWRWWITNNTSKKLTVNTNWDDAYQFGSSYLISGSLTANEDHIMRLFKTQLTVEQGDKFQFVYKTNTPNSLEVQLGTKEGNHALAALQNPAVSTKNGWTIAEYDLSSLNGKTVSVIALNIKSSAAVSAYSATLGEMLFGNSTEQAIGKVQNLTMQNEMLAEGGDIRLYWDAPASGQSYIHHYDLYVNHNGTRSLVGQTKECAFYIPKITPQSATDKGPTVDVVPVSVYQKEGESNTLTSCQFPAPGAPVVSIQASQTLVKPGTSVTFTATATQFPKSYEWTIPAGATNVTYNTDKTQMTCTLNTVGQIDITVAVTNENGTTSKTEEFLVEVSNTQTLSNVSVHKTIDSSTSSSTFEGPQYLIDGDSDPSSTNAKWCVTQTNPWVIIDLENIYRIYRFNIFDCKVKEDGDNVKDYDIEVSMDKEHWTKVFSKTNNTSTYHVDWCKPTVAQYVRWNITWSQPTAIRVWEFEVYGVEAGVVINPISNKTLALNNTDSYTVSYDMQKEERGADFNLSVTTDANALEVSNLKENATNKNFTFDVKAKQAGTYTVTLQLTNNGITKTSKFDIEVVDQSATNILLNQIPTLAQGVDYDYKTYKDIVVDIDIQKAKLATDGDEETGVTCFNFIQADNLLVFEYTFDKFSSVPKYELVLNSDDAYDYVYRMRIKVSDDGSSYTTVYEGPSKKAIDVTPVPAKKYRFEFDKNVWSDITVQEIRAIGSFQQAAVVPEQPTFSVLGNTYQETKSVELTCSTDGATIYYTTDGSTPTITSTPYVSAIVVDHSMTIKAIAVLGQEASEVVSQTYDIVTALEQTAVSQVQVYPTSVSRGQSLTIANAENTTVQMVTLQGQIIKTEAVDTTHFTLHLQDVLPGTYMVVITDSMNHRKVSRIVVSE